MHVQKCPNTFDKAFICKLVDIISATVAPAEAEAAPYLSIPNIGVTYHEKLVSSKQLLFKLFAALPQKWCKWCRQKVLLCR